MAASSSPLRIAAQGYELPFLRGAKRVLLVNPPVADTVDAEQQDMLTCVEPFGLLRLATWFRERGCEVQWLDCLRDPSLQGQVRRHVRKRLRCGNEAEEAVDKSIHHFGLDAAMLEARLRELEEPDLIAISTIFTWHVEATRETIAVCKRVHPKAKVLLGGNFATLCPDHARTLGADAVVEGDIPGALFLPTAIDLLPRPHHTDFVSMVKGCPHHCEYCVTNLLNAGHVETRPPERVYEEMRSKIASNGTRTFVFYDDFIQFKQARFLDPLLDLIIADKPDVHLEFALGFSSYMITEPFAARLHQAKVERVILALETISEARSRQMQRPQSIDEFVQAVHILRDHGYRGQNIRAFYLIGLPGQTTTEILKGIGFLYSLGVAPSLTTYTLTPRSGDWARYSSIVGDRPLDELAPCLWRFAHPGMRVRELDAIYRYFHEKYFPIERILASNTDDPLIRQFQDILRNKAHLPESW